MERIKRHFHLIWFLWESAPIRSNYPYSRGEFNCQVFIVALTPAFVVISLINVAGISITDDYISLGPNISETNWVNTSSEKA